MFSLTKTSGRQREIIEIVLGNGWDYMRGLLVGGKADEPQLPPPAVFKNILTELGPFYVKIGQLLSTRPDLLPPEYIQSLTALQAEVPPVPWLEIEAVIKEQLSQPITQIFSNIDPEPVAAGSIAQVHHATLINGESVALKVQRPGIDRIVDQDIILIKAIAELVSLTEFGQDYNTVGLAEEFTQAIKAELDFTKEAGYTDQLRQNLATSKWFDSQKLVIPKIYWSITTEKLLTLEWLVGQPILQADVPLVSEDAVNNCETITTILFRAFFQQMFIDGFFHADPHPGNIFYLDNSKVALIDCGSIGSLDPRTQKLLTEMLLAIIDMDASRCSQLTLELSENSQSSNLATLENDYDKILRRYYNLNLAQLNFSEIFYEVLQLARKNKIKLPRNLGLFTKTLANLEGVARQLNPNLNLLVEIKPLMTDILRRQLIGEAPIPTLLRTVLDFKSLSLQSPRQLELLLERLGKETLQWNISVKQVDSLRRSVDDSANRLSFSIVVGSLIMGAAIISTGAQTQQLALITDILFAAASFLGLWLLVSILRSGRLK
ncbi:putative unusual protein kinase [Hyella patelloides LEGE 07179]|uniref:Putative unusual protein kinase n=1 Tax=Hyella patelloides LEGE 07179 TaxID=945734 RepID=A0A563VU43_9CYAN|nr:AarF/ABC1/UbiB kinase family protein [Hyella patelloides]VEP14996.1 putative unusual protein kinase [Hyella patelloides LEGE 07179]